MKAVTYAALFVCVLTGCGSGTGAHHKRVIVLGVDGMDPGFVERHWSALPNLRRLRERGGLLRLATTTPPQSPVAWSTFMTGTDPEVHGVFDFVHRDPQTLRPISSMGETVEPEHEIAFGPYLFPLDKAYVRTFRKGRVFWQILAEHGIPAIVMRMPTNYPPIQNAGEALAGMGTPDLEGTAGTFTYYTDDPLTPGGEVSGGRVVRVVMNNNRVILPVFGPPNPLRRDHAPLHLDLVADVDPDAAAMRGQIDGQQFILKQGEWSPWIRVRLPMIAHVRKMSAMIRLYARELHPAIRIYRSPLNADPGDPALAISAPHDFSAELAANIGPFYTQGIEEDTSALRQGALDMDEYLQQSRLVMEEHSRLLAECLGRFHEGLLFFYFSEIDQNSHMLWGKHDAELLRTYEEVDKSIGRVLDKAGDATVIVMSDHGFAPFNRAVNLNTWLKQEGYPKSRAYALGLNALYVPDGGAIGELARKLLTLRDPETGQQAISEVKVVGKNASPYAPDLIVGYARGYRASWATALGDAPDHVIETNNDAWIGDHCMAASVVPGVLLGTKRSRVTDPALRDLSVTILKEFGVAAEPAMTGRALY